MVADYEDERYEEEIWLQGSASDYIPAEQETQRARRMKRPRSSSAVMEAETQSAARKTAKVEQDSKGMFADCCLNSFRRIFGFVSRLDHP